MLLILKNVMILYCERLNSVLVEVFVRLKMIIKVLKLLQENNNLYINVNFLNLDQLNCQSVCDVLGIEVEESGIIFNIFIVSSNLLQCIVFFVKFKFVNIKDIEYGEEKVFLWFYFYGKNGFIFLKQ